MSLWATAVRLLASGAIAWIASVPTPAVTLLHMNLSGMVARAETIFRGTVIRADSGTVSAGGITLPTLDYTIRVDEAFLGHFSTESGQRIFRMRMIGKMAPVAAGAAVHVPALRGMPRLEKGKSYVLFTTAPGPAGLSTTVGLDQGCFRIVGHEGGERVVNGFGNIGLFAGMKTALDSGAPVDYERLSDLIRSELAER